MVKNHSDREPSHVLLEPSDPIPSEQEAEARLHREGFESFRWHDVPGTTYPNHRHSCDECIWVLQGEIHFRIGTQEFKLKAGDRLYLPAYVRHTVIVPREEGVTYLVGELTVK